MTVNTFDPNASDSCSTNTLGQMLDNQPVKPTQARSGAARIGFGECRGTVLPARTAA